MAALIVPHATTFSSLVQLNELFCLLITNEHVYI